jgi:nitric oxide reductase subunit B
MSIPVLNLFTHGTHVTVAHSMGTTIGINSMILLSACFYFINNEIVSFERPTKILNISFWLIQIGLALLFISLNISGVIKGIWQLDKNQNSFSAMMIGLKPFFVLFIISGITITSGFFIVIYHLLRAAYIGKMIEKG